MKLFIFTILCLAITSLSATTEIKEIPNSDLVTSLLSFINSNESIALIKEVANSGLVKDLVKNIKNVFTPLTPSKESVVLLKEIVKNDVIRNWNKKLGDRFAIIAKFSKKFGKYAGSAGEAANFILMLASEQQEETIEYLMNITNHLDKIDVKLEAISEQIANLDTKLLQSTQKIVAEVKLVNYNKLLVELRSLETNFESVISGFTSDPTSLLIELDKFINDYINKGSDSQIVDILDSNSEISNSIAEDLIALSRSYRSNQFGSPRTSTMKIVLDFYMKVFMTVLKGNVILDTAVNIKESVTGNNYESERRKNHYRRSKIFETFFNALAKTFHDLTEDDLEGFIDFNFNGKDNEVRLKNVLQYFWENEDQLSIIDTCSDDCEHFVHRKYSGGGCYGEVRNCEFGVSVHNSEQFWRQSPQIDRIYLGYTHKKNKYGQEIKDESNYVEKKKSYPRGFYNCHVCKCVCDQYSNINSVRKIYTGILSAPDGYVVTGMKFIERNKIIYPQIQVGKLLPMATIDQSSIHFVDVPDDENYVTFDFDKHKIIFDKQSSLALDTGVVTGVQFERKNYGASWSIYGRKLVDFNRGILGEELHIESSTPSIHLNATNLIPGLSSGSNFIIRKNVEVNFGISNEQEDAGQSFVPYFDGTEISFNIKSPLSGITLIQYTNDENYAGYIRPVLRIVDYRKLFNTSYEIDNFDLQSLNVAHFDQIADTIDENSKK